MLEPFSPAGFRRALRCARSAALAQPASRKCPASRARSNRLLPNVSFVSPSSLRLSTTLDIRCALSRREVIPTLRCHCVPGPQSTSRCRKSERSVPRGLCLPFPKNRVQLISFFHPHSAPSIGHGFGGIPAPCSFGSSAFPSPPKNSSQTTSKTFCAPPEMQTLALGADPSRYRVPQLQGQKWRLKKCTTIESNSWAFWGRTRKANQQKRQDGR